ncbi:C40 family peptidase [Leifsonia sp. YAF41]|uniref:C40 family peptidase n=1 Tax=Leifsonia sp. YAF41 TaxID=3233086 RepID=UPI003F98B3CD
MAMIEAVSRIAEIENRVLELTGRSISADRAVNAASFDAALGAAGGTKRTTGAGTNPTATGTGTGVSGDAIVEAAKKYLGVPYVFGGEDASGMDCSGLVQRVLADLGIDAPRVVSTQQSMGTEVGSLADAQPGDLIVTHNADHIVIYAGNGMIIHAPYEGRTVSLQKNYLTDADIQTIRRVAAPAAPAAAPSTASAGSRSIAGSDSRSSLSPETMNSLITSMGGTASASPSIADLIAAAQMSMFAGSKA